MVVIGPVAAHQGLVWRCLQVPALLAQVAEDTLGVLVGQFSLRSEFYLKGETQVAQHEGEGFGQEVEALATAEPYIGVGLAQACVDEAVHDGRSLAAALGA